MGLRLVRDLEQGKPTLRLDKVNRLPALFGQRTEPVAFGVGVRMLESHFLVAVVARNPALLGGEWQKLVCEDLILPSFKISRFEAVGRRLKRNYGRGRTARLAGRGFSCRHAVFLRLPLLVCR